MKNTKFKYYMDGSCMEKPEPMFGLWIESVNGFTDVCGETLLGKGEAIPLFPDYKTWCRMVMLKKRCGRCWAIVRSMDDLIHHNAMNHLNSPIHMPAGIPNTPIVGVLLQESKSGTDGR